MSEPLLPFLDPETPAAPIPEQGSLSKEGTAYLEDDMTVEGYLVALREAGEVLDAIRVVAAVLPPAVAVDWARSEVLAAYPDGSTPKGPGLMAHVDAWMEDPEDDDLRRAAMDAAEEAAYEGPEAWVTAAAGWSGGSIAPPAADPVPPPPGLAGRAASGAIIITMVRDAAKIVPEAEAALERGLALAAEVPMAEPEPEPVVDPDAPRSLQRPVGAPTPTDPGEPDPGAGKGLRRITSLRRPSDPGA